VNTFEVGDRVVVVDYPVENLDDNPIGITGTVSAIEWYVRVNLDTVPLNCDSGDGWLFQPSELKKVEE